MAYRGRRHGGANERNGGGDEWRVIRADVGRRDPVLNMMMKFDAMRAGAIKRTVPGYLDADFNNKYFYLFKKLLFNYNII